MSDTSKVWLQNILAEAAVRLSYMEDNKPDDFLGWGTSFEALLQRLGSLGSSPKESRKSCGILLTGPAGCGKHTAACHMCSLLRESGYETVFLDGLELNPLGAEESIRRIEALLDYFLEKGQGLCIQLEELENCPFRRELLSYFGRQLLYYRVGSDYPPLFLILIDKAGQDIPSGLRGMLMLCRVSLPDEEKRRAFLEHCAADLSGMVSYELFAELTEGADYAMLTDMALSLGWLIDSRDMPRVEDETLRAFVRGQMPAAEADSAMSRLAKAVKQLVDGLPSVLEKAGSGIVAVSREGSINSPTSSPANEPVPDNEVPFDMMDPNKIREILKRQSARKLAEGLFGKEKLAEMLREIDEFPLEQDGTDTEKTDNPIPV